MSRRNYKKEQSYIDWLKSLGCVLYAPLDGENQFKDLVSGNIGQLLSGSVAEYDSDVDGYTIQSGTKNHGGILFNLNGALSRYYGKKYIETEFTLIVEAEYYNSNVYFPLLGVGSDGYITEYIGGYVDSQASNQLKQLALVKFRSENGTSAVRKFYSNAVLSSQNTTTNTFIMDSGKLGYVLIGQSNNNTGQCTVKNAYVFNCAISESDIQNIYNHDHN